MEQAVGSTIHCVAGDATGVLAGAVFAWGLLLPMSFDVILEYVLGFAFGLFIFQSLFTKGMAGGSYMKAVKRTIFPEWLSMNSLMGGMIPLMMAGMTSGPAFMEPKSLGFWGVMSLAIMCGAVAAFPVNLWLVARGLKHGMGTGRALGKGGHTLAVERQLSGQGTSRQHAGAASPSARGGWETALVILGSLALLALGAVVGLWFLGRQMEHGL